MSGPEKLTIYEKPTCTTCRSTMKLLNERGVDFENINYFAEPLSAAKIAELLDKAGDSPRDWLRTREQVYKNLGLASSDHTDVQLIELMAEHPDLLQRPIAELGPKAVLGRPPERILEIID